MANGRKAENLLAVDRDIAPLQARFFDYANTQVRPENRQRAYELINQTFGSVQAVRDAQREREREQLDLENRRIALETNRLQLAEARESVAARQEQAKIYGQVKQEMGALAGRKDLSPEQKHQEMLNFGAAYGDLLGSNSALKYQYQRNLAALKPAGTTEPKAEGLIKGFEGFLKEYKDDPQKLSEEGIGTIDEALVGLEQFGLLKEEDKKKLHQSGISVLTSPEQAEQWGDKEASWQGSSKERTQKAETRAKVIREIFSKAKIRAATRTAPAAAAAARETSPVDDLFAE